jgi:hypothetical protein
MVLLLAGMRGCSAWTHFALHGLCGTGSWLRRLLGGGLMDSACLD